MHARSLACHVIFGPPMQTLKTNPAIQTLETNPANHLYPEPSPWPFWISAIVDNMHGGPYISNLSWQASLFHQLCG